MSRLDASCSFSKPNIFSVFDKYEREDFSPLIQHLLRVTETFKIKNVSTCPFHKKKFNIKTYVGVCQFDYGIFNDAEFVWKWQERPARTGQTKGIFCGFWELEAKQPSYYK